jgi:hypothetical protein
MAVSRREMIASGAAGLALATTSARAGAPLTVAQVLERMHGQIGTPWREGAWTGSSRAMPTHRLPASLP